jgi:hypothetical protein
VPQVDPHAYTAEALSAYREGNLALADILCDTLLRTGHRAPMVLLIQGLVAVAVREFKRGQALLTEAQQLAPLDPTIKAGLEAARKGVRDQAQVRPDGRKRYLLIKPWGFGFCSDLDHVLGCLLLAEMTARTPVVYWGDGSLFRDDPDENAWDRFFEPVSTAKPADLFGKKLSYFPPKWNDANIHAPEVNKLAGEWARVGGLLLLNRREDIAVSDMHVSITNLQSWIRPGTPLAGKSLQDLYRTMVRKHLRPSPEVTRRVDDFARAHFTARPIIGVHARGGDKPVEDAELLERNKQTPQLVDDQLRLHPAAKVFLLTDDAKLKAQYAERYGDKLITTDCLRTTTAKGVHYTEHESRSRLGVEVMTDMYLAARCDHFIGVGTSNVSAMIEHLKDWPPGACDLRPFSLHYSLNPFLFRPTLPPDEEAAFQAAVQAQQQREAQG